MPAKARRINGVERQRRLRKGYTVGRRMPRTDVESEILSSGSDGWEKEGVSLEEIGKRVQAFGSDEREKHQRN